MAVEWKLGPDWAPRAQVGPLWIRVDEIPTGWVYVVKMRHIGGPADSLAAAKSAALAEARRLLAQAMEELGDE